MGCGISRGISRGRSNAQVKVKDVFIPAGRDPSRSCMLPCGKSSNSLVSWRLARRLSSALRSSPRSLDEDLPDLQEDSQSLSLAGSLEDRIVASGTSSRCQTQEVAGQPCKKTGALMTCCARRLLLLRASNWIVRCRSAPVVARGCVTRAGALLLARQRVSYA